MSDHTSQFDSLTVDDLRRRGTIKWNYILANADDPDEKADIVEIFVN
jgi:hypothetical protein